MTISELIAELEAIRQEHGDIAVDMIDAGDTKEVFSVYVKRETFLDSPPQHIAVIC